MDSFLVCPSCRVPLSSGEDALACRTCGTRYPVDGGIADFSGGRYYDGFVPGQELSAAHQEGLTRENEGARSRIVDFYLPLFERSVPGRRVLDCGCGNGMSVDLLSAAGWEAWGNDLSALRKWQWRERERRDRLIVADGGRLPFASGSFDAVVSSGVLEHIGVGEVGGEQYKVWPLPDRDAQRLAFVAELLRVTAPGGRLFLDFPNGAFPIDFWHGTRPGGARFHPRDEGFLPTVSEVRELLVALDPDLALTPLSPRGRLQFRQAGGHWYGKALKAPMSLAFRLMTVPGFRFLAGTPLNPFLVLEIRREG